MAFYDLTGAGTPVYSNPTGQLSSLSNSQAAQSQDLIAPLGREADPFAPERPKYQKLLSDLWSNPGDIATSPFYQFALDQGTNAVNRSSAARGLLGSGNRLTELQKFGTGLAGQQFLNLNAPLMTLSGATTGSPAASANVQAQMLARAQAQRQQALAARNSPNPGDSSQNTGLPSGNISPTGRVAPTAPLNMIGSPTARYPQSSGADQAYTQQYGGIDTLTPDGFYPSGNNNGNYVIQNDGSVPVGMDPANYGIDSAGQFPYDPSVGNYDYWGGGMDPASYWDGGMGTLQDLWADPGMSDYSDYSDYS